MLKAMAGAARTVIKFFIALVIVALTPLLFPLLLVWVRVFGQPAEAFPWGADRS